MQNFKTVTIWRSKEGNVHSQLLDSLIYLQVVYCFPFPSEYFENIEQKLSTGLNYLEQHITFTSEEKYHEWFDIFGEIMEELMGELELEANVKELSVERYYEKIPSGNNTLNIQLLENFVSEFNDPDIDNYILVY